MAEETSAGAEILPGQAGITLVVVTEDVVQLLGPVDGVDDLGLAVKDVGRYMDGAPVIRQLHIDFCSFFEKKTYFCGSGVFA